jgi:hypothetical protein
MSADCAEGESGRFPECPAPLIGEPWAMRRLCLGAPLAAAGVKRGRGDHRNRLASASTSSPAWRQPFPVSLRVRFAGLA